MADRALATSATKPIWMKQAEEAKIKSEAEKTAAAKAALEATFKALEASKAAASTASAAASDSSDDDDRDSNLVGKPAGPIDPSKSLAAGAGIAGGTAGSPSTFTVVAKDSDGRRILVGGAEIKVKISPGVGVGVSDVEGIVKDQNDGSYAVTYAVSKRGNYMVHVECNGRAIMGSPFPVFFSAAAAVGSTTMMPVVSSYSNMVNQTMPNMPNYSGSVSGAFPGFMGMVPGMVQGVGGGGLMLGMTGGMSTMGTLSQQPMAPSAAAMAAAQAIVAARQAAQMQAQQSAAGDSGSLDPAAKADVLERTLQVSNLSPLLTAEHLKQLFAYCGTVVDCSITDSKHSAYIEFSKPEEATAALALNNMDVGGRPLNVEMAKSLPSKSAVANNSLPLALQQAVALQQMQFQQALLMQQTIASQQAASRAATMKSATDMAAARALEISKKLKAEGLVGDDNDTEEANRKFRSPSPSRLKSKSRSPIKHWRSRRSRSISPSIRFSRHRRSRSPIRFHHYSRGNERRSYKDDRDSYSRDGRREMERSHDHYSYNSRRNRSRSASPRARKPARTGSISPKHRRVSTSPQMKRPSRAGSRSPLKHHEGNRSPTRDNRNNVSHRSRHSGSRSPARKHHISSKEYAKDYEILERKHHYRSKGDEKEPEKSSAERKHHPRRKEDGKVSEKTKDESRKSDRIDATKNSKGSREPADDRNVDLSAINHKRDSLPEDGSTNHEPESNHHKRSKLDQNTEKSDIVGKDQNGTSEDLESIEEKRSAHKKRSTCNDDDIHGENRESGRHERSSSSYKKYENQEYDTVGKDQNGTREDLESIEVKRSVHKQRSTCNDDDIHGENRESGRHERSRSSYKKHERTDSAAKERDSTAYESSRSRDDRRSSHHSSSRSHRNSEHTEKRSRYSKSHCKEEKTVEDYEKSHRADTIVKESRSSDKRHERLETFPKMKSDRSSSYSPEDEVLGGLKGSRERTKKEPKKIDPSAVKPDPDGSNLESEKQDASFDHNLMRSPKLQDYEISISTENHGERKASELKLQNMGYSDLIAHGNVQHAVNPGDGTVKDMEGPTPKGLADEVPKMVAMDSNMEIISKQDRDFGHGNSSATHSPIFNA